MAFMKKKLKEKKTWGYLIPTFALVGFAIFLFYKGGGVGSINIGGYKSVDYFHGGSGGSDLDIKRVRWHKHNGFERVVLDVFQYNGMFTDKNFILTNKTGTFQIGKEKAGSLELDGEVKGFRSFSANIPNFYKSKLIESMEVFTEDSSAFIFTINLKKSTSYKVFTLTKPARIIIDLKD
jgi:hypothetical protein